MQQVITQEREWFKGDGVTAEERQAGVEVIQNYGFWNTLDALADGDIFKFDAVTELPYWKAIYHLKFLFDKAQFRKRLSKILSERTK